MGVVDKLQTLAKTELKIVRETAVTSTTKATKTTTAVNAAPVGSDAEALLEALETAQKRSTK